MSDIDTTPTVATTSTAVFRLIYRSRSCIPPAISETELSQIFSVSRHNNTARGITGALMMHHNWFAQVLEGPEAEVRALYARIKLDPRHEAVELTDEGMVAEHMFGRWAMAEVKDQGEQDVPLLATTKGLAEGAPWRVSAAQQSVLTQLRTLTRG